MEEQLSRLHTKTAQLPVFECDAMLREEILDIQFNIDKSEKDISAAFSPYIHLFAHNRCPALDDLFAQSRRQLLAFSESQWQAFASPFTKYEVVMHMQHMLMSPLVTMLCGVVLVRRIQNRTTISCGPC